MRIIICCNVYPPNFLGGAELVAHYHAKALQNLGHEVLIFTGDSHIAGERHALIKDTYDGLPVFRVRLTQEDYSHDYVNFFHRDIDDHFQAVLTEFSPDVVHFHNIIGLSLGMIHRAKREGAITALTVHDHWGFCHKNTILRMENEACSNFSRCSECLPLIGNGNASRIPIQFRRDYFSLMLEGIDVFISPSRYLAEQYLQAGIGQGKFKVIGYGIDVERFSRIEKTTGEDRVRFTFVGNFGKHKGVPTLLEALPCMADKSGIRLNLVGEGEQLPEYRRIISALGLEARVEFWGKIDHTKTEKVYRETDVFILPSVWPENQPVTIMEAMSARIPVIASNIGGNPELIDDGINGFLFRAGDAKNLAQKMSFFVSNRESLITFGEKAYRKMKDNTYERSVTKQLAEYRRPFFVPENRPVPGLVVCIGEKADAACQLALNEIKQNTPTCRFISHNWLETEHLIQADLFWVIDKSIELADILHLFEFDIPFLVPEYNHALAEICRSSNCGLYFWNSHEARTCIEYLLGNPHEARTMGNNCKVALNIIQSG